jgi:hypothetical protein
MTLALIRLRNYRWIGIWSGTYLARQAVLIGIDADRPEAWNQGSLDLYFEPGFEPKPLEKVRAADKPISRLKTQK